MCCTEFSEVKNTDATVQIRLKSWKTCSHPLGNFRSPSGICHVASAPCLRCLVGSGYLLVRLFWSFRPIHDSKRIINVICLIIFYGWRNSSPTVMAEGSRGPAPPRAHLQGWAWQHPSSPSWMLSPLALETCTQIAPRPSAFTQMLTLPRSDAWVAHSLCLGPLSPLSPLPSPP